MTPTVPPPAPCTTREMNKQQQRMGKPKNQIGNADAANAIIKVGRRPTRSENLPQSGALNNCATV
jgi:hypothetical protein